MASRDRGKEKLIREMDKDMQQDGSDGELLEEHSPETVARNPKPKWARPQRDLPSNTTFRKGRSCKVSCGYAVCTIMLVAVAIVLAASVGLFVGQSLGRKAAKGGDDGGGGTTPPPVRKTSYDWGDEVTVGGKKQTVLDYFVSNINASDIKENLRMLTEQPHIAGSERNYDLAVTIYNQWRGLGFDSVEIYNYSVLLSYPDSSNPNSLTLRQNDSELIYNSHIALEPPLTPGENNSDVAAPFNAYSGSGNVSGPLVYVNYGGLQDYRYLTSNSSGPGLNLTGYICIARYGNLFRGDKAHLAQRFGCKGLIIYSDPQDYAPEGVPVYPDGPSLPEYGVQRGSLQLEEGDVLTPDIPAIPGVYRRPYSAAVDEESVPRIPVQPISYGDAVHFMEQLTEHSAPSGWVGALQIQYNILQSPDNTNYTELVVNNYQEQRNISNVVAKIYGSIEPDRQVILGNHRDAWTFGAVDPNSGTAGLMNVAKVIGQLRHKSDWRPGRTITLCSWDAEEYGLIGSTEWVEDLGKLLEISTIAYLNVDVGVGGTEVFYGDANSLLYEVMWYATSKAPSPSKHFKTVYDHWKNTSMTSYQGIPRPSVGNIGSGSDFTSFLQLRGISCTTMGYSNRTFYPVYHSVHDNFNWISTFADPDFTYHRSIATVWVLMAVTLATQPLPPLDANHLSDQVLAAAEMLQSQHSTALEENDASLDVLLVEVRNFQSACDVFSQNLSEARNDRNISQKLSTVRILMDKVMNVERAFILPMGLPGRPHVKHMVMAPSAINSYGSVILPGLSDAITDAVGSDGSWETVRRQRDLLLTHLRYATQILSEPTLSYLQT